VPDEPGRKVSPGRASVGQAEVHVVASPEMRALYEALKRGASASADNAGCVEYQGLPGKSSPCFRGSEASQPSVCEGSGDWPGSRICLRRDGGRPIVMENGLKLLSRELVTQVDVGMAGRQGDVAIRQRVSLYAGREGGLAAQIVTAPIGTDVLRPVYSAGSIASLGDLDLLLVSHDPARGWSSRAMRHAGEDTCPADPAARLGADLRRLLDAAIAAAPMLETESSGDGP